MARPAIDLDYLKSRLADLLNTPSPTGYTDEAVWQVCRELQRLGLDYELVPYTHLTLPTVHTVSRPVVAVHVTH